MEPVAVQNVNSNNVLKKDGAFGIQPVRRRAEDAAAGNREADVVPRQIRGGLKRRRHLERHGVRAAVEQSQRKDFWTGGWVRTRIHQLSGGPGLLGSGRASH